MEQADLPREKAFEPDEEARQPVPESKMTPKLMANKKPRHIAFADDTDSETASQSQKSSSYKEVLSQPAAGLSHRAKLLWLQKRRSSGLWAQCEECNQWRYLPDVLDSKELPETWYCRMNPDRTKADCSVPQAPIRVRDEEDLIHAEYSAGSVVWARVVGWPWWPAVVDDCPDTEQYYWLDGFSDIPTHYNVTFFDGQEVTRGWVSPENLKPYAAYKKAMKPFLKAKKYETRLRAAIAQADAAVKLSLAERLEKYSFLARYSGMINSPKSDKKEIKKQQALLKRKFNIRFEEDDDCLLNSPNGVKFIIGTHKSPQQKSTSKRARRKLPIVKDTDETDAQTASENPMSKDASTKSHEIPKNSVSDESNEQEKITEPTPGAASTESFKEPASLVAQVGSTDAIEESFDNDTSKTYAPEQEPQSSTQSTFSTLPEREFQVEIVSPGSDDFEY